MAIRFSYSRDTFRFKFEQESEIRRNIRNKNKYFGDPKEIETKHTMDTNKI